MEKKQNLFGGAALVAGLWLLLAVFAWFGPRTEVSEAERRKLEQFPQISAESLFSGRFMSRFETITQDQFPLRDRFRQLKALFSYNVLGRADNNGIYLAEGFAAKLEYPLNMASVEKAKDKFTAIYERYLQESAGRIVFCVVPDKGYYLAEANGYPAMDYDALYDAMAALPWAQFADIRESLSAGCYYRTDTHWRQELLLPAAQVLADALDIPLDRDYRMETLERPFYGVYYGQAALPMEPERISILRSDVLDGCTVTNFENNRQTEIYDMDKLSSRDLYDVFLSGPVSVLQIDNPAGQPGRELVVFRDSFGSSMVPLLVSGYERVTLVDIRYVPADYLENFVDFHGQDILFLYSPLVLNNSTMLK